VSKQEKMDLDAKIQFQREGRGTRRGVVKGEVSIIQPTPTRGRRKKQVGAGEEFSSLLREREDEGMRAEERPS